MHDISFYNYKMVRLDDLIFFIGGSHDAEGRSSMDQTLCFHTDKNQFAIKKQMSYKRCKVGVCPV
jgi:hypothetical protein